MSEPPVCPRDFQHGPMRQRLAQHGPNAGNYFFGCQEWPDCDATLDIDASGNAVPAGTFSRRGGGVRVLPAVAAKNLDKALERLDDHQALVARWSPIDGNLRVLASAGSGKSTTVCALVASLIATATVDPTQIIVTTFTKKAGDELIQRISPLVGGADFDRMRIGTTHALAFRALRELDRSRWDLARGLVGAGKRAPGVPSAGLLWKMLGGWGTIKGTDLKGLNLEDELKARGKKLARWARQAGSAVGFMRACGIDVDHPRARRFCHRYANLIPHLFAAWELFEDCKKQLHVWDFDDVLMVYGRGLADGSIHDSAAVIAVDEAQDYSVTQLAIAAMLVGYKVEITHDEEAAPTIVVSGEPSGRIILVGDARQSIFSFRGAFPELFIDAAMLLGAKTLELPTNYRSGAGIVNIGNAISEGHDWAVGMNATPHRQLAGEIRIMPTAVDPIEEAAAVIDDIKANVEEGTPDQNVKRRNAIIALRDGATTPGEEAAAAAALNRFDAKRTGAAGYDDYDNYAILVRTNAHAAAFEAGCIAAGVPCVVVGGTAFFARADVNDFLAYCALSQHNALNSVARICNKPKRYLGRAFIRDLREAHVAGADIIDTIESVGLTLRSSGCRRGARGLAQTLRRLRTEPWAKVPGVINGLLAPKEDDESANDEDARGIFAVAATIAGQFDGPEALINFAAACANGVQTVSENANIPPGKVTISTIHRAKGRQFKRVYVAASEGTFPHAHAQTVKGLDEERRLFYVAVTRAEDTVTIASHDVNIYGGPAGPSSFVRYVEPFRTDQEGGSDPFGFDDSDVNTDSDADARAVLISMARTAREIRLSNETAAAVATQDGVSEDMPQKSSLLDGGGVVAGEPRADLKGSASTVPSPVDWDAACVYAARMTEREPATTGSGAGSRYVEVSADSFEGLLSPLGFAETQDHRGGNQRVWAVEPLSRSWGTIRILVYSTIPRRSDTARDVGEDSIKVGAAFMGTDGDQALMPKMEWTCRTRGWRMSLLDRIERVRAVVNGLDWCPVCGAPMRERKGADGLFLGCRRYVSGCRGSRQIEIGGTS